MRFQDIDIEITGSAQVPSRTGKVAAQVRVLKSPVGEWSGRGQVPVLSFDQLDLLEDSVQDPDVSRPALGGSTGRNFAAALGEELYNATLGQWRQLEWARDQARSRGGDGVRLRIRSDSALLAAQPWELLYVKNDAAYLALQSDVSIVREVVRAGVPPSDPVPRPMRILLAGAVPADLTEIAVEGELAGLDAILGSFDGAAAAHLLYPATFEQFRRKLADEGPWHVVHFSGHGYFDPTVGSMLIFETPDRRADAVSAEAIAAAVSAARPRLVVVNACRGSMGEARGIVNPLARVLIGHGVPAAIAMQFEVTDRAALPFAATFYRWLLNSGDVERAINEARANMSLTPMYGDDAPLPQRALRCIEWCTPVLHLDAQAGLLFQPESPDTAPEAPVSAPSVEAALPEQLRADEVRVRRLDRMHWELAFTTPAQPVETILDDVEQVLRAHAEVRTLKRTESGLEAKVGGVFGALLPAGLGATELVNAFVQPAGRVTQVRVNSRAWQNILDQGRNEALIRRLAEQFRTVARSPA